MKSQRFFVSLCLCLPICSASLAGERLRIMTLNAEWLVYTEDETDKDPWGPEYTLNEHFERIAGIIETLEPDVVNLVEATSAEAVDYLVGILHEKGLTDYKGYHIKSNDTFTGQDIAVVTKKALVTVDGALIRKFYSSNADGEWREPYSWTTAGGVPKHTTTSISKNAVYAVQFGPHKLGFLGLHFKAFPNSRPANAQRTAQSKVAQKIIREQIVGKGLVPIVLGDLNDYDKEVADRDDTKTSKTSVLKNLKDYDASQAGDELINAASKIDRVFDRFTAHHDKDHDGIPDEGESMTMIDHILIHKDLMTMVKRVFIDHGHGSQASDHWPVIVDLEVP